MIHNNPYYQAAIYTNLALHVITMVVFFTAFGKTTQRGFLTLGLAMLCSVLNNFAGIPIARWGNSSAMHIYVVYGSPSIFLASSLLQLTGAIQLVTGFVKLAESRKAAPSPLAPPFKTL